MIKKIQNYDDLLILKLSVVLACLVCHFANVNISYKAVGFAEEAPCTSKHKEPCIIATAVHAF